MRPDSFLADADPTKRETLIDRLLRVPTITRNTSRTSGSAPAAEQGARSRPSPRRHVRVSRLVCATALRKTSPTTDSSARSSPRSGSVETDPPVAWYRQVRDAQGPELEEHGHSSSSACGIQCAQVPSPPRSKNGSQQDYYSFSAFFFPPLLASRDAEGRGDRVLPQRRRHRATNPKNEAVGEACRVWASRRRRLLPTRTPRAVFERTGSLARKILYFAKIARQTGTGSTFFSRGIVEGRRTILRETNPPDESATPRRALRSISSYSGYDMKDLVADDLPLDDVPARRDVPNEYNRIDKQNFSRYYPKRLAAENAAGRGERADRIAVSVRGIAGRDAGRWSCRTNSFNATSLLSERLRAGPISLPAPVNAETVRSSRRWPKKPAFASTRRRCRRS